MAGYNELRGLRVKYLSADPANPEDGQVWYNSTTGNLRVQGIGVGAWSSGGPLTTARFLGGAFGTQTAAVYSVGQNPPASSSSNATEEYNGLGWSNGTNYPTSLAGTGGTAGTQTNGLFAGGPPGISASNLYDGSTWTATGSLNNGGDNIGNCGTGTTSDVIFCIGRTPATGNSGNNQSETFDGSTFTTAPNYNTSRMLGVGMGSGTATAGLIFGGFIDPSPGPTGLTACEEYNGTSWTTVNGLNRSDGLSSGWGTQTNTIKATGQPSYILAEQYDGSTWTNISDMSTGGPYGNSAGSTGNAGMVTGLGPTRGQTEEYNFSSTTVTPAAWSSGGNLNNAIRGGAGIGTRDAAIAAGGISPAGRPGFSEEYNGTAWTNLPTIGRSPTDSTFLMGGNGTSTAGLITGGMPGAEGQVTNADEWNGSAWTAANAMSTGRQSPENLGVQTAAFVTGGRNDPGPIMNTVESYDGTNWTSGTAMSTARYYHSAGGTTSSGWVAGGQTPSVSTATEEWNGSSWTAGGDLVTAVYGSSMGGPQTSAFIAGGRAPSDTSVTQHYNGTSWVTAPSISAARGNVFGSPNVADNSTGLIAGGTPAPANTTATEEFTGETVAVNPASNLSVS